MVRTGCMALAATMPALLFVTTLALLATVHFRSSSGGEGAVIAAVHIPTASRTARTVQVAGGAGGPGPHVAPNPSLFPKPQTVTYGTRRDGSECVNNTHTYIPWPNEGTPRAWQGIPPRSSPFWTQWVPSGTISAHDAQVMVSEEAAKDAELSAARIRSFHAALRSDKVFNFKTLAPASLDGTEVHHCDPEVQLATANYDAIHPKNKMLLLIGAQKGGTTWLWQALQQHESFIPARDFKSGRAVKEPKWFAKDSRFEALKPAQYLRMYLEHASESQRAAVEAGRAALLEATPSYLSNTDAAPRVRRIAPHARFVIVLRDPVARAISALKMFWWESCLHHGLTMGEVSCSGHKCNMSPPDVILRRGLDVLKRTTKSNSTCFFNHNMAHMDLHDCHCAHPNSKLPDYFTRGDYAPQISWWLSFFPTDRFLILTSEELKNPDTRVAALNRVMQHAGLADTSSPFEATAVDDVVGFKNNMGASTPPEVLDLVPELRRAFFKPMRELHKLINQHWPGNNFTDLVHEV